MKKLLLLVMGLVLVGPGAARADDPFDPTFGPRNPRPAAEAYLNTRPDIAKVEKTELLGWRPVKADVLANLAAAPVREVRAMVAGNISTTPEILAQLAQDTDAAVRQYVAGNVSTPAEILAQLNNDKSELVRWSVQHNPAWPKQNVK